MDFKISHLIDNPIALSFLRKVVEIISVIMKVLLTLAAIFL